MNKKKMMIIAYSGAFVVLVILAFFLTDISGKTPEVILPTPNVSSSLTSPRPGDNTGIGGKEIKVTADNVQNIIAIMNRQENYSENVTVTSYWSGGKAEYKISASVRSGACRLSVSGPTGTGKNIIISGGKVYVWYDGSKNYYSGNAGTETALYDRFEMIPTYEDILKLPKYEILEATFKEINNEPCIYVRAQSGELDYIYEYYVSVNTGLLTAAFIFDDKTLVYSMAADSVQPNVPSADMFKLPDGNSTVSS